MPPNHTDVIKSASHSQLSTYGDCGKRYELTYIRRVKRRPGVWFPAGTAFHATVQQYLLASLKDADEPSSANPGRTEPRADNAA